MLLRILFITFAMTIATLTVATEHSPSPINWQELPKPYHTKSATNPPWVSERPKDASLLLPDGFVIEEYLTGFKRPRFMVLGPDEEILLSDMGAGIIYLIRDKQAMPLIKGLHQPYGMAFYKQWLYVADADAVRRYIYKNRVAEFEKEIVDLRPYSSGHITRSILFDESGEKMYLGVGSKSNVSAGEPPIRAAINRYNPDGSGHELFATGIRNPIGMRWLPSSQDMWVTSHERDALGDDLVPDYFTRVRKDGFYGWPYAYIGPHEDPRHKGVAPDKVAATLYPNVLLGSHVGSMDFIFYTAKQFPKKYHNGAFIALHGSWNRSKLVGYKIVFVPFENGEATSGPVDFLTGWIISETGREVWGRPVGLLQLPDGSLLVSDDGGGKLWRISYQNEK